MNGRPELISLLQYMRHTTLDNEGVTIQDKRIVGLNRIVEEVKQSEEWEAVKMNILEIGIAHGLEQGREQGIQLGIQQGIQQGNADTLKSIIKNMLRDDMTDENIRLYTGCEQDFIDKIKLEMNK